MIGIYSRSGFQIAELDYYFRRTWKLNDYGEGSFSIPILDPKATAENLNYNNLVYVDHDRLPPWAGFIVRREWEDFNSIRITCYSAEKLLWKRVTPKVLEASGPPGLIVQRLINHMYPAFEKLPVRTGQLFGGCGNQDITYNFMHIDDAIRGLSDDTGCDWDVMPVIDKPGRLYFEVNWYERRGRVCDYALIEDKNLELSRKPLKEDGDIVNYVIGYGAGSNWNEKPVAERQSDASINQYGLTVDVVGFEDGKKAQLNGNTLAQVDATKDPFSAYDFTALDFNGDDEYLGGYGSTFDFLDRGNILPIELYSVGFNGGGIGTETQARITGMTYDHENNKVELVMEQYNG